MPCCDAMITDVISGRPDHTVAEILEIFEARGIRAVPILDDTGKVLGKVTFQDILMNILPVPVTLEGGLRRLPRMDISLAHISGATPWVAKRLHALLPRKVSEIMVKNPKTVESDTPLREGVRLLVKYGSPLLVVNGQTRDLVGLISSQTAIKRLLELKKEFEANNPEEQASA